MLLSKSGPTDICPHPLPAIRSHDRTPMPTKRGAKRSATPTGAACQMLRQIQPAVKLRCAKLRLGFPCWFHQRCHEKEPFSVMAGLDPAIHVLAASRKQDVMPGSG